MMKVIQFRFARFRAVFGRKPARDEPLFFDPGQSVSPVLANNKSVIAQIAEAAYATGADLDLVLSALALKNRTDNGIRSERKLRVKTYLSNSSEE
jgi:hypothetical protein